MNTITDTQATNLPLCVNPDNTPAPYTRVLLINTTTHTCVEGTLLPSHNVTVHNGTDTTTLTVAGVLSDDADPEGLLDLDYCVATRRPIITTHPDVLMVTREELDLTTAGVETLRAVLCGMGVCVSLWVEGADNLRRMLNGCTAAV